MCVRVHVHVCVSVCVCVCACACVEVLLTIIQLNHKLDAGNPSRYTNTVCAGYGTRYGTHLQGFF